MLAELTAEIDRRLVGLIRGRARRKSVIVRILPARWLDPLLATSVRRLRIQLIVGALGLSLLLVVAGLDLALLGKRGSSAVHGSWAAAPICSLAAMNGQDSQVPDAAEDAEQAAQQSAKRIARLRGRAVALDTRPGLLAFTRRLRQRLPGDEQFGDPLSTAGLTSVELIARGVSALQPDRPSVVKELGFAGLQVWQSLSEATGRGRGDRDLALLFTDLVGFSSWALEAGDAATLELLRAVGLAIENAVLAHDGRIVKRLGDGVMASFVDPDNAVAAALDAGEAVGAVEVAEYQPQIRAGIHWGRPRKLGGDYLGVDVNIAARVADAAKANEVLISEPLCQRLHLDRLQTSRPRRLKAEGVPRGMRVLAISRAAAETPPLRPPS